nr:nodulation protein [Melilotus officinalis]
MAMQLPSSSSFCSVSNDFTYDVFISFRGSDTFTGNLYKALSDKGIHTFIDDEELKRGDEITPSLLKSIEDSRVAIIVFSKDYASSSFCLDELSHIIHYFKEKGRLVLPVFYDVDPSHVRHQNDSYGEALAKHHKKSMDRLLKWKKALSEAANLSGYHINPRTEYEYKFIEEIVKDVSNKINRVPLHVANYLVGLESRISKVSSLLDLGSDDGVCIIGILGTGGMGKTTLAEAVYNSIADQFDCKCFLHNVREDSDKHGLQYLQKQLLSESIGFKTQFGHVNEGIPIIRQRLCQKKVLLILNDVDKLKQLEALVGEPGWLGRGSRVIITTRDKHLLSSHEIKKIYEADGLNEKQALELLRTMALRSNKNDSSYDSILNRAAKYASGLPLALEVVGSNLSGRSVEECESLLDKYERIPHKDILKTLKVCLFGRWSKEWCNQTYILEELKSHYDHCLKFDLSVLVEKSLIKIETDYYSRVRIHDLIEDMGKEIVRQESPNNPGERSRLWFHDDIVKVLEEDMGTAHIKMIYLKGPEPMSKNVIEWNGNAFKKMTNLKTLVTERLDFSKGPEYLPSGLRVLRWHRCPLISLSSCISNKASEISSFSNCKFNYMKDLTLDDCKYLTHIPDVSGLPNLEKFSFQNCHNLITIHNSIGYLDKLEILNGKECIKLDSFPPLRLPSLKELKLECCTSLKRFPEILCKMTNIKNRVVVIRLIRERFVMLLFARLSIFLKNIGLYGTPIEEFRNSFQNLSEIRSLDMYSEYNEWYQLEDNDKMNSSQNVVLSKMKYLVLARRCISDECLLMLLNWCLNVTLVDLSESNLKNLPECLRECHLMRILRLDDCEFLEEIRGFPPNLEEFSAIGCYSLSSSSRRMLLSQAGYKMFRTGTEGIPDWFEHQSRGHKTISFRFRKKIPSINVIILVEGDKYPPHKVKFYVNDCPRDLPEGELYENFNDIEWLPPKHAVLFDLKLEEVLLENEWITVMLKLENVDDDDDAKDRNVQMGIHVWMEKNNMEEDVIFTNPYSSDTEEEDDESKILEVSETETVDLISSIEQIGIHEERNTDEDVILNNPFSRKRKSDEDINASLQQKELKKE